MIEGFPEPPNLSADESGLVEPPVYGAERHRRTSSSDSSIDWKTWLAANVSKLEPQFTPAKAQTQPSEMESASPRTSKVLGQGHIRERAQICGDDDEDANMSDKPTPKASLSTVASIALVPSFSTERTACLQDTAGSDG